MSLELNGELRNALFDYLIRIGDDKLIIGHRLSEWCGHAPILEEDIALANIALDSIGQSSAIYKLASEIEMKNRTEDDFAFFRNEYQFKNLLLVEQPNIDFAQTIIRQLFFTAFEYNYYTLLKNSRLESLAGIASRSLNEVTYHLRHVRQWTLHLGDGTEESHFRTQNAVNNLWRFTEEMFTKNDLDENLIAEQIVFDNKLLKPDWYNIIEKTLKEATLEIPQNVFMITGGREGRHSEYLGHLLAEMQIVARSFPGATW